MVKFMIENSKIDKMDEIKPKHHAIILIGN